MGQFRAGVAEEDWIAMRSALDASADWTVTITRGLSLPILFSFFSLSLPLPFSCFATSPTSF
jgi:hypothetical protein